MQHSIIKKDLVHLAAPSGATERSRPRASGAARPARHSKSVQLLRVGEHVQAVELTCSCGEVSVIEFEYPDPSTTGASQ